MEHYLDNAATTQVSQAAADAAFSAMREGFGNPSSRHALGSQAKKALDSARTDVAAALGCAPDELFFTSCGTEGDNWAIHAAAAYGKRQGKHIVTSLIEHAAVLEPVKALEREGYEVTYLKPDKSGLIDSKAVEAALRPDTVLVSLMLVNNELGTLLPVRKAADAIRRIGCPALLHTDAVQGFLKVPFTPKELGADLVTISGHKIHAPKGVGALYIRRGLKLSPLLRGGGQENGLRSGTEATAQIAAFAAACREGKARLAGDIACMTALRAYAVKRLREAVPEAVVLTEGGAPHILPISLPNYKSEVLVRFLSDRGVYVSSGSACHRGKPSHVYAALGLPKQLLDGVLRVSFCGGSTEDDVNALCAALAEAKQALFPTLS